MRTIASFGLGFQGGGSDKVYHAQVVDHGDGTYSVPFQYGRRGSLLHTGIKCNGVPFHSAAAVFRSLYVEKTRKGYKDLPGSKSGGLVVAPAASAPKADSIPVMPQLLRPVEDVEQFLEGDDWILQTKEDGERRAIQVIGGTEGGKILGFNRRGQHVPLPAKVENRLRELNAHGDFLLDGELVGDRYVIFDLVQDAHLQRGTMDGTITGFRDRFDRIDAIGVVDPNSGIIVKVETTMNGAMQKRAHFNRVRDLGGEGVVFKRTDGVYTPGLTAGSACPLKYKFVATATVLVTKVNDRRSVGIGMMSAENLLVPVGNVTIPANQPMPKESDLIEVRYLYAYPGGSLYQPVFIRKRDDLPFLPLMASKMRFTWSKSLF